MAKFDVYPDPDGHYWLDCQADLLRDLNSRFVVPLRPAGETKGDDRRLNPRFQVNGSEYIMFTHFAAAVPAHLLRQPVMSLAAQEYTIGAALDMLIGGY